MKSYHKYTEEDISMIYRYPDGGNHEQHVSSGEWKTSQYLPKGWFGKGNRDGHKFLMNDNGKTFSSYKAAVEAMQSDLKYSEEDISKIYHYPDGENHARQSDEWKESHYLPTGWLGKDKRAGASFLMDVNGTKYVSYRSAVEFMKSDHAYSQNDISMVYLYPDGKNHEGYHLSPEWQGSNFLPKGWLGRQNKPHGADFLMSDDGTKFSSYLAATGYMKFVGSFTQEAIDGVYLYPDGKSHKTKSEACLKRNKTSFTLNKIVAKKVKQDDCNDETTKITKDRTIDNILDGLDITVSSVKRSILEESPHNFTELKEHKTTKTTDEEN